MSGARAAPVRAAGGVVRRWAPDGEVEVLLVHRPRYGDWTFPKGKSQAGETEVETALREVEEETGLRCEVERELAETSYRDSSGRHKVVRYFVMRPGAGAFVPHDEVDEVEWFPPGAASERLTYPRDREVLAAFVASLREGG